MAAPIRITIQVVGVLFVLGGAVMLGMAMGKHDDSKFIGAGTALCGAGSAMLAVTYL